MCMPPVPAHPRTRSDNWKRDILRARDRSEAARSTPAGQELGPGSSLGWRLGSEQHKWLEMEAREKDWDGIGRFKVRDQIMLPLKMTAPEKAEAIQTQRVALDIHRCTPMHRDTHSHPVLTHMVSHTITHVQSQAPAHHHGHLHMPWGCGLPSPRTAPRKPSMSHPIPVAPGASPQTCSPALAPGPPALSHLTAPPASPLHNQHHTLYNTECCPVWTQALRVSSHWGSSDLTVLSQNCHPTLSALPQKNVGCPTGEVLERSHSSGCDLCPLGPHIHTHTHAPHTYIHTCHTYTHTCHIHAHTYTSHVHAHMPHACPIHACTHATHACTCATCIHMSHIHAHVPHTRTRGARWPPSSVLLFRGRSP